MHGVCNCTSGPPENGRCGACGDYGARAHPRPYPGWPAMPAAPAPRGWECPKCGGVYSPSMPMCTRCGPTKSDASNREPS